MTKKCPPKHMRMMSSKTKQKLHTRKIEFNIHTTIKQNKKKLRGHTELLMLPKNKSSNCSLLIHFFYYKKKKEKKLLRFTFIPVYNVDVL